MSVRFEHAHADYVRVTFIPPGQSVDGDPDNDDEDMLTESGAVVLGYDEAFVLEGGPEAIRALAGRILDALPPEQT